MDIKQVNTALNAEITSFWANLAPHLCRQRIIIEGLTDKLYVEADIIDFMEKLSHKVGMRKLGEPFAYPAEDMGYGGWIHWVTSGAHVYTYPAEVTGSEFVTKREPQALVTVDAYTCKPFSLPRAIEFTREYFKCTDIVWREIKL